MSSFKTPCKFEIKLKIEDILLCFLENYFLSSHGISFLKNKPNDLIKNNQKLQNNSTNQF